MGLSSSRSPFCVRRRLSPSPLHDTESTPGATWHVRRIAFFSFSSCRCPWCWQDTLRTRRVIQHVLRLVSCVSRPAGRVSNRPNSMRVSSFAPHVVVVQAFSSCCGSRSAFRGKTSGIQQPHGEQAAASLDITVRALDPGFHIYYKFVLPAKQTTGGGQRLVHIGDFPCGVHVAPCTRLDTTNRFP